MNQVANEIDQQPSGGVFLKQNDQLVSWVMGYVPNGLSRLNTLEHHRRRGFAALAIKYKPKEWPNMDVRLSVMSWWAMRLPANYSSPSDFAKRNRHTTLVNLLEILFKCQIVF